VGCSRAGALSDSGSAAGVDASGAGAGVAGRAAEAWLGSGALLGAATSTGASAGAAACDFTRSVGRSRGASGWVEE
jgi:hypothetical protein